MRRGLLALLTALLVNASVRAEPIVVTLAGSGPVGWENGAFAGEGLTGADARLDGPTGVAVNASGGAIFADYWNHRIRTVDQGGTVNTVAGSGWVGYDSDGTASGTSLWGPWGVAPRGTGFVFTDTFNSIVRSVDGAGTLSRVAGTTGQSGFGGDFGSARSALLDWPLGVATDSAGNVYVADSWNNRIRRFTPGGNITTVAGDGWSDAFGRGRFAGDGGPATAASLNWPSGVAVDADGNIFIADTYNHRLRRVDAATGFVSTIAGSGEVGSDGDGGNPLLARLNHPAGIALAETAVYVADSQNHRVRAISGDTIQTVAGTGTRGLSADPSPAHAALFNAPQALAVLPGGDLLVADTGNNRIRRVIFGETGFVTGVVRDQWTLAPIPNALVAWEGIAARADAAGAFTLAAGAGAQTLTANAATYGITQDAVTVPAGGTLAHDIALPSGFVSGFVTDEGGHIVAGAQVASSDSQVTTGTDGAFTLRAAPGSASLLASATGFASSTTSVTVPNGDTVNVRLVVYRTRSLPIALNYDKDWISTHGNPGDYTTPSSDFAFPAEQLPLSGSVFTTAYGTGWVDFIFPNTTDGAANVLFVNGQTLSVTPGRYSGLHLLESAQFGAMTGSVTLRYADGGTTAALLTWSDWAWNAVGQALGANETVAIPCTHRHSGSDANASPAVDILHSSIVVDPNRTLTSFTLPADTDGSASHDAYVFAASLDMVGGGSRYGDADTDGVVTLGDAALILNCAAGIVTPSAEIVRLGDLWPASATGAFGDNRLDIGDALAALRKAQGL